MRERCREIGVLLFFLFLGLGACKRKTSAGPDAAASDATSPVNAPAATCTSELFPTACGAICCPRRTTCDLAHEQCIACSDPALPLACGATCCAKGSTCETPDGGPPRCVAPTSPMFAPTATALASGTWTRASFRDESCRKARKPPTAFVINSEHGAAVKAAKAKGCVPGVATNGGRAGATTGTGTGTGYFCCPAAVVPPS